MIAALLSGSSITLTISLATLATLMLVGLGNLVDSYYFLEAHADATPIVKWPSGFTQLYQAALSNQPPLIC